MDKVDSGCLEDIDNAFSIEVARSLAANPKLIPSVASSFSTLHTCPLPEYNEMLTYLSDIFNPPDSNPHLSKEKLQEMKSLRPKDSSKSDLPGDVSKILNSTRTIEVKMAQKPNRPEKNTKVGRPPKSNEGSITVGQILNEKDNSFQNAKEWGGNIVSYLGKTMPFQIKFPISTSESQCDSNEKAKKNKRSLEDMNSSQDIVLKKVKTERQQDYNTLNLLHNCDDTKQTRLSGEESLGEAALELGKIANVKKFIFESYLRQYGGVQYVNNPVNCLNAGQKETIEEGVMQNQQRERKQKKRIQDGESQQSLGSTERGKSQNETSSGVGGKIQEKKEENSFEQVVKTEEEEDGKMLKRDNHESRQTKQILGKKEFVGIGNNTLNRESVWKKPQKEPKQEKGEKTQPTEIKSIETKIEEENLLQHSKNSSNMSSKQNLKDLTNGLFDGDQNVKAKAFEGRNQNTETNTSSRSSGLSTKSHLEILMSNTFFSGNHLNNTRKANIEIKNPIKVDQETIERFRYEVFKKSSVYLLDSEILEILQKHNNDITKSILSCTLSNPEFQVYVKRFMNRREVMIKETLGNI